MAGCKGQNKGMGGREEDGELAGEGRGLKPTPFLLFRPDLDQPEPALPCIFAYHASLQFSMHCGYQCMSRAKVVFQSSFDILQLN